LTVDVSAAERQTLRAQVDEATRKLKDALRTRMEAETALKKSQTWYGEKAAHLKRIDDEILKQKANLPEAGRRLRQHTYLLREAEKTIERFRNLLTTLEDDPAMWSAQVR